MKPARKREFSSNPSELQPGDVEYEMGVALPGLIQPKENWTQSALKRLPIDEPLDLHQLFGRQSPVVLEIGCGNGRFTLSSAVRRPDWDHLAIDILPAVLRYATRRANQRALKNVRIAACDGWRCLSQLLMPQSLNEIHIYHPQPYADPTQTSKRMLTPEFVELMTQSLKPGGQVFLQSDRAAYWQYIGDLMSRVFDWQERMEPWPEDPTGRSRRELLSIDQGLTVYRGVATWTGSLSAAAVRSQLADAPQPDFRIDNPRNKKYFGRRRRRR